LPLVLVDWCVNSPQLEDRSMVILGFIVAIGYDITH